jgi:hypothetical protein
MKKSIYFLSIATSILLFSCTSEENSTPQKEKIEILNKTILSSHSFVSNSNDSKSGDQLFLSSDGLYAPKATFIEGINSSEEFMLIQQGDSNLVVYTIVKGSGTMNPSAATIKNVVWSAGCVQPFTYTYKLVNQSDGNIVIYKGDNFVAQNAIWHTNTATNSIWEQKLQLTTYRKTIINWQGVNTRDFIRFSIIRNVNGVWTDVFGIFDKQL